MDTDAQALEAPSSPPLPPRAVRSRPSSWSSSASSGSREYTSLRDVLLEMGPRGSGADVHDFDTANINIRNQQLKHAASAYLQSAIVVTPRDRGCLSRVWRRMLQRRLCRFLLRPCAWPWLKCECAVDNPVHRCAASLVGSARRLLACLPGCVTCIACGRSTGSIPIHGLPLPSPLPLAMHAGALPEKDYAVKIHEHVFFLYVYVGLIGSLAFFVL